MTRCDPAAAGTASRHGVERRKFLGRMIAVGGALAPGGIVSRLSAQSRSLASVTIGDGFELFYEVHGDGPPVVFAHGGGGTRMSWWQQIPAMSEHFRCITFDHRGFGHSRDVGAGPGHRAFVDDLRGLLDHLGIDRAALVGQSMGGWTTLGFASAWPERVSALVLCNTHGGYTDPEVARLLDLRPAGAGNPADVGAYPPSFAEREPELAFLYRQIRSTTRDRTPAGAPRAVAGLLERTTDIEPVITHQIPILFVTGEEDRLMSPAAIEEMHRKVPNSEFALVPGAGHSVYYEMPRLFNRLVIEFLKRYTARARR